MSRHKLIFGDCLDVLRGLESGSVDAVVTDPPGGIKFMGKKWDYFRNRGQFVDFLAPRLAECLRVARPGARMLCWALPRTSHWAATAIEDAGWIIENKCYHLFGQGFPKGKSQLKPAVEEWVIARKPGGKVPDLNIDATRINPGELVPGGGNGKGNYRYGDSGHYTSERPVVQPHVAGRWPANLCLSHHPACRQVGTKRVKGSNQPGRRDGSIASGIGFGGEIPGKERRAAFHTDPSDYGMEAVAAWECHADCPVAELDRQSGDCKSAYVDANSAASKFAEQKPCNGMRNTYGVGMESKPTGRLYTDSGGASRFFATFGYFPKASRRDRGEGNTHPTVKSQDLMRWLIRLICKPGETLIDPFAGSGSTLLAAMAEGVNAIGIEDDSEPGSFATAERRLAAVARRLT